jgi:citrate lyase subunit beta/citryl-CoA lyase
MRSLLFIPADDENKLAKGLATGADGLIVDLEDSVSPARKPAARSLARQYIAETGARTARPQLVVRINALDTPYWQDDLVGVMDARPDAVLLPKARSGEDVHTLSVALGHAEQRTDRPGRPGPAGQGTRIIALTTETPISLLQMHTYVGASTRLLALTWGAEDLSAAIGARTNREDDAVSWTSPFRLARDLCLFTAAAAGVAAIDTVFVNFRDQDGFRAECQAAARDGFSGKMAIHPNQVAIINEAFTPTAAEIALAEEIVQAFEVSANAGVLAIRGQMVDKAHIARAERLLARAKAAGVG